jgi:hypothetical protein
LGSRECDAILPLATGHEANACEAQDHHGPGGWLGNSRNGISDIVAELDVVIHEERIDVYLVIQGPVRPLRRRLYRCMNIAAKIPTTTKARSQNIFFSISQWAKQSRQGGV